MKTKQYRTLIPWALRSPIFWFWMASHTYLLVEIFRTRSAGGVFDDSIQGWASLGYSYLTLLTAVLILQKLTQRWRWGMVLASSIMMSLYSLLAAYLFGVRQPFDIAVMLELGQKAGDAGMLDGVVGTLDMNAVITGLIVISLIVGLELTKRLVSANALKLSNKGLIALLILYGLMLGGPYDTRDEVTHFIRSGIAYAFNPMYQRVPLKPGEYPFLKTGFTYTEGLPQTDPPPHVFLIVIESFNEWAIEQKGPNGKELTPEMNQLIQKSVYVDRFYGNNMCSIKGYNAITSGLWPALRGLDVERDPKIAVKGLPHVLNENGYYTVYFQAQRMPDFHYVNAYMKKIGFQNFGTVEPFLQKEDEPLQNNMGHEDEVIYKRLFDKLDQIVKERPKNQPIFTMVTTIYSHMRFNVPEEKREFYKDPHNFRERFSNSIYMSDQDLPVFFQELNKRPQFKNAIVIITGDHSYPLGNHGISHSEVGFYDESFRIPFLIFWPGKLAPKRISEQVYSQVDIAPTLIDLLKLKVGQHNFVGRSIFAKPIDRPTFLVQPYSGTYTSIVRYPYKYIFHHRSKTEYLFNLQKDPGENINVLSQNKDMQQKFKADLKTIFLNQQAIQENIIFPKGKTK